MGERRNVRPLPATDPEPNRLPVDLYGMPLETSVPETPSMHDRTQNKERAALADGLLHQILTETLYKGWHGEVSISLTIRDGMIEYVSQSRSRKHR